MRFRMLMQEKYLTNDNQNLFRFLVNGGYRPIISAVNIVIIHHEHFRGKRHNI